MFRSMEVVLYCLELDKGSISKGELNLEKLYTTDQPMPRVNICFSDINVGLLLRCLSFRYIYVI